ncbi:uncharacterized protein LOC130814250 [Amaranthus tricolor]|uniref:uncharacterized protein LOC130814250 n=1 Tax=Amaranthus tricolor TaxID=29722 RepID=UPI002586B3EF|nr:uncharacterized protein LOC130814250 [Amaranthus tricolor]
MVIDNEKASTSGDKRKKSQNPKGKDMKKVNDNACWECGKPGHRKKNCFVFKNKLKKMKGNTSTSNNPPTKGNLAILDENSSLNLSSMDSNVNIVQDDDMSWWIDSGASRHVCKSKHWFKTLHNVVDGENLYMGDNSSIEVHGKG